MGKASKLRQEMRAFRAAEWPMRETAMDQIARELGMLLVKVPIAIELGQRFRQVPIDRESCFAHARRSRRPRMERG